MIQVFVYEYNIKTWSERIKRWLVNGRYAKKKMEGVDLLSDLVDSPNFWVQWGMRYLPLVDGWKHTAVEEIIQFFLMPEIIVGIQFEAELVDYFEVTLTCGTHTLESFASGELDDSF